MQDYSNGLQPITASSPPAVPYISYGMHFPFLRVMHLTECVQVRNCTTVIMSLRDSFGLVG